jgi:hypothetical protein
MKLRLPIVAKGAVPDQKGEFDAMPIKCCTTKDYNIDDITAVRINKLQTHLSVSLANENGCKATRTVILFQTQTALKVKR